MTAPAAPEPTNNFIRALAEEDLRTNRWGGRVVTRFPPEPNKVGARLSRCCDETTG